MKRDLDVSLQQAPRSSPAEANRASTEGAPSSAAAVGESPEKRLDRLVHARLASLTAGLSPVSISLALADWAWHLTLSPGRQLELAELGARLASETLRAAASAPEPTDAVGSADDDPRFRHPDWSGWPYNVMRTGFRNSEAFWREAAQVNGMTAHHAAITQFLARQWLAMLTPANWLATNPVVIHDAVDSAGSHLLRGAVNLASDIAGLPTPEDIAAAQHFRVGVDVAVTPGKVVFRNRLIELIRYAPQTAQVHPEPMLIVPSWIMKYYILDLSPDNSMVRYLVEQGHTVYMLSWRNPDASDHELSMEDYLQLGIFDALGAVGSLHGASRPVHAVGYCLGGTLLAIAAAAFGRPGGVASRQALPPLQTLTLLAAETDFSEPGELGLFIDESQIDFLDDITRGQGYLSGRQMAGTFQFLHSRDLVWTRRMREYLMGEREQRNDLMAWNADTTRMPARMHHEYLVSLYLNNALATGRYTVQGRAISLADIRMPVFMVGTERDHVSPWRSVYKLHNLCSAEISFVLTTGGHNAGIVSEPGHAGRSYRVGVRPDRGAWVDPDSWMQQATRQEGSWWPAWREWLAARSSPRHAARPIPRRAALCDAPGGYVLQRYAD